MDSRKRREFYLYLVQRPKNRSYQRAQTWSFHDRKDRSRGRFIVSLQYPGQSLCCELYRWGGIRAVEMGSAMFGRTSPDTGEEIPAPMELVRLAIPRRVYTQSHIDYVVEAILEVHKHRSSLRGYRMTYQAPFLRHFTARFEPISE